MGKDGNKFNFGSTGEIIGGARRSPRKQNEKAS